MSSGIFQYERDPLFEKTTKDNPAKEWTSSELIDLSYKHPLYFQPGQGWHYSNANYLLAGEIIEKITKQPLNLVLQQLIQSQQLPHTAYVPGVFNGKLRQHMTHGYRDQKDITFNNISAYGAAGAMVSTSQDIAKWAKALFSGEVVPKKQLDEFMTTIPFDAPPSKRKSLWLGVTYYIPSNMAIFGGTPVSPMVTFHFLCTYRNVN